MDVVSKGAADVLSSRPKAVRGSLSQAISKLEKEMELVDGKVADLMKKYAVTQKVADEAASILENSNPHDFLPEPAVPSIDR